MFPWILIALISLGAVASLQELKPQEQVTKNVTFGFNEGFPSFSADSLRLMSFGYPRVLSNLLWLRFMQHTPPERIDQNSVSWIYLDLDAISTLDPEFKAVFQQAAIFLSVVTTDKKGAELLLEKGVRLYPNDWRILANMAYHQHFELENPEKAAEAYLRAGRIPGAPPFLAIIGAGLLAKRGELEESVRFLEEMKERTKDEKVRAQLDDRIKTWKEKYGNGGKS